jgi:proline iminopeptidase
MGPPQSGHYKDMYATGFWGGVRQKHWLLKLGGERYQKTNYTDWIFSIWFSREYSFADLIRYGKGSAFSAGNIIFDEQFNDIDFFKISRQLKFLCTSFPEHMIITHHGNW